MKKSEVMQTGYLLHISQARRRSNACTSFIFGKLGCDYVSAGMNLGSFLKCHSARELNICPNQHIVLEENTAQQQQLVTALRE